MNGGKITAMLLLTLFWWMFGTPVVSQQPEIANQDELTSVPVAANNANNAPAATVVQR